jgi:GAF domain-containing protein
MGFSDRLVAALKVSFQGSEDKQPVRFRGAPSSAQAPVLSLASDIKDRYGELQILHELSQIILASPDMKTTLSAALRAILATVEFDLGNIRLFDAAGKLKDNASLGYHDERNARRHLTHGSEDAGGVFAPRVIASKRSLVVEDVIAVEGLRNFKLEGVRSAILVPIATADDTLGILAVGSRTPREVAPEKVRLLEAMGAQIGIAIQKARLFDEMQRTAQEQAALSAVTIAANKSLDVRDTFGEALEKVLEVTGRERGTIRIKDDLTGHIALAAHRGFSPSEVGEIRQTSGRMAENVFATGKSSVLNDSTAVPIQAALLPDVCSLAAIPIIVGREVVGVLTVSDKRPMPFEPREVNFLENIGHVIGVAVQNSRHYLESLRGQEVQKLLKELSQDITTLDLGELFQKITDKIREFFKVDISDIRLLVEQGSRSIVGASGTDAGNIYQMGGIRGRTAWIVEHRRPLVIADAVIDQSIPTGQALSRLGIRGYAAAPLFGRSGDVIGVLRALSFEPRQFSETEVDLLQQLANGIAIALENARLFEETRAAYRETQVLHEIAQVVLGGLDLRTMAQRILNKAVELGSFDFGTVVMTDGNWREAIAHFGYRDGAAIARKYEIAGREHRKRSLRTKDWMVIEDVEQTEGVKTLHHEGIKSAVLVPIVAEGENGGVLQLGSRTPRKFDGRELALLKGLANLLGIGLQKARLFQETEQHAQEQATISAIAMAVSQSLEQEELLGIALDKVLEATGRDRGYILLRDAATGDLSLAAHKGVSPRYAEFLKTHRRDSRKRGKTISVITTGEPLIINNEAEVGRETSRDGQKVIARIPLKAGGRVVGVLNVASRRPDPFEAREIELLQAIGNVIGVALENARLFQQTDRHLKRLQALREIDQAISSTLDLDSVLKILLEKIDVTLPYASATIRLINHRTGLLEPVACRNLDEDEWKNEQAGRGIPNVVFATKSPLVIRDVRSDARATDIEFYRKHDLVSYVGVPLIVENEIIGVLGFYTKEEHDFEPEEVNFLATLAGQAAIAIQHSQLYEEARLRETQLEESNRMLAALHAAAAAASQSLDLDRVLRSVIEKITEIFNFGTTQIHIYDPARDELMLGGYFDSDQHVNLSVRSFRVGEGVIGKVAATGNAVVFEDIAKDDSYRKLSRSGRAGELGHRFFAVFPIRGKLKTHGTVAFTAIQPRRLSAGETKLIEALTDQLAIAIENNKLYDELKQKLGELQRANKVKDEFLSVMSHELRTPLNVVIGYASLIREGMLGPTNIEQGKALDKLVLRTHELLTMITGILYAASIEANEVRVDLIHFALGGLLDQVRRAYAAPLSKPVALEWNYPADLPVIRSDPDKIRWILQALVDNGIKFTDSGRVAVTARVVGEWMELQVSDTGIGISEEKLALIFDKFRQADGSETRRYGGIGLGLYIAQSFTRLLGGTIEIDSAPARGSTFTVKLPCAPALDARAARAAVVEARR